MRRIKICAAALAAAVLSISLPGCMPHNEIKNLSIVEGVGVDAAPNGQLLVTYQLFKPTGVGGQNGGPSDPSTQVNVVQTTGKSLFDASRSLSNQLGKRLYYSDVRTLILGKDIAKSGMSKVTDFLERNHEIQSTQRMIVADDKAANVLMAKTETGFISAQQIQAISQNNENNSKFIDLEVGEYFRERSAGFGDFALPIASVKPSPTASSSGNSGGSSGSSSGSSSGGSSGGGTSVIKFDSTAIFRKTRMVGVVDPTVTRGILWVRGMVKGGTIIVYPFGTGADVSLEVLKEKAATTILTKNGKPAAKIDISITVRMAEQQKREEPTVGYLDKLRKLSEEQVKDESEMAINGVLRKYGADVFDFAQKIYRTQPQLMKKLGDSPDLHDMPVEISVKARMTDLGLISD